MIQGERVKQARALNHWTQTMLLERMQGTALTQSRLSRIEKGTASLAGDQLEAANLAAATGVTVDWLTRRPSDQLGSLSPHFRARSRTTEGTKATGIAWAELVNEAHVRLEQVEDVQALKIELPRMHGADPRYAAQWVRQALGFDSLQPLPYLLLAVERLGVRVLGMPWATPTIDAFCAWAGEVPTIALTSGVPGDRRRWTLSHELGHLVLHHPDQQGKDIEAQADAFAAELLTPLDGLRLVMPAHPTLNTLTMLKSQWGVSVKSLVRRARELGVADDDRATSLYRQISARGWNKAEPGHVAREKPRALRLMVEIAFGAAGSAGLAEAMGWSHELAHLVLDEHARADELPSSSAPSTLSNSNVRALGPRRTAQAQ